jgi:hypothetical protein
VRMAVAAGPGVLWLDALLHDSFLSEAFCLTNELECDGA